MNVDSSSIISLVLGCGLALLVIFFKNKADKSEENAIETKTKTEDLSLQQQQLQNQQKLSQINKDIEKLKNEHAELKDQTDEERAKSWNLKK